MSAPTEKPYEVFEKVHVRDMLGGGIEITNLTGFDLYLSNIVYPPTKVTRWMRVRWAVADWLRRLATRVDGGGG